MNISQDLNFSPDKPAVLSIWKTEKLNLLAIGLLENQWLAKHKTSIPTTLTVLKGSVEFHLSGTKIVFQQYDAFQIPVNIEHEVMGLEAENIFTLTQEK